MAQPLIDRIPIVGKDGLPTDYFIRLLKQRGITVDEKITAAQAIELINAALAARDIIAGVGLDGGGSLDADVTIDLGDTAVIPGTYGDSSNIPQITVDQQGRITNIVNIPVGPPPTGAHQYWRVVCTSTQTFFALGSLEMRETLGGENIAQGQTYAASTEYDGSHLAAKAFTGYSLDFWSTTSGTGTNGWLRVDFGPSGADIQEIVMANDFVGRYPSAFDVEWSDDGSTWTNAWSGTLSDNAAKYFVSNASGTTDYNYADTMYRVRCTAAPPGGGGYMSYAEVVFETTNGSIMKIVVPQADSNFVTFTPDKAFDRNFSTQWITAAPTVTTGWIGGGAPNEVGEDIAAVTLTASAVSGEGGRCPTSFDVEYTDDGGGSWITLGSVTGLSAWSDGETRTVTL